MDGTDKIEEAAQKDIPKHPIKTYRWEDVRRSRLRGAYPWTHLTKPPFDEELDPEGYTMDAFRRSRSTSTIGKSETQDLSEIEDVEMKEEAEKHKEHNGMPEDKENINPTKTDEPSTSKESVKTETHLQPSQSAKESRCKSEEPRKKRKLSLQSSCSKLNLSKQAFMDKFKEAKSKLKVPKLPKRSKSDASDVKQAKKQKTTPSSTKQAKSTKVSQWPPVNKESPSPVYIHIPLKPPPGETDEFSQLEFESPTHSHSGSLTNLPQVGQGKRKMSLLGILTEIKKVHDQKLLASEARRASQSSEGPVKLAMKLRPESPSKTSSTDISKDKPIIETGKELKSEIEESSDSTTSEPNKLGIGKPRIQRKESDRLVIEEISDDDRRSNKSAEDSKPESERTHKPRTPEPIVVEPEDSSADDNISQYLDKEDKCEIVSEKSANVSTESINQAGPSKIEETPKTVPSQQSPVLTKTDPEKVKKLEVTLSKWKKTLPPVSNLQAPVEKQAPPQRAKSEEPKRKRRSSIDSSYSRKSLSKLAFIKKIKEAKDKIKLPKFPSFTKADKKDSDAKKSEAKKSSEKVKPEKVQGAKKEQVKKTEKPVYIHIPLKLPPGETDEFSYLADESKEKAPKPEKKIEEEPKKEEESSVPTSPETPTNDIQLIILTPPSDDEILDTPAVIPETPSEPSKKFFENVKIEDLKTLAKNAVDTIDPDAKKLETVKEDEGSDEQDILEEEKKAEGETEQEHPDEKKSLTQKQQQMLVDEEDGLQLSDAAIAMINEELAKEIKKQEQQELKSSIKPEVSPPLKKKVSFKRRSKGEDGERIYEDVKLNKDPNKVDGSEEKKDTLEKPGRLESFQSMSVDEEKSYLDKKVIKDTSLEEDYNKWSKINDHEYEPVNPPPEEMPSTGHPPIHVVENNRTVGKTIDGSTASPERHFVRIPPDEELVIRSESDTPEDELGAQEVQRRIEDRFFNATPETVSSRTDGELHTSQADSSALETLPLKRENRKKATKTGGPTKSFNETLRSHADKIKVKWQGIKKPNITLPQRPKFSSTKLKKPNFKKPSFKMPKMPERPSINLPSFNLTRKDSSKDSWRERQFSTESNVGDSKKKIFDFKTYPRIFDRNKKNKESSTPKDRAPTPPPPEFATVPRVNRKKGPIGSRWANKFKDIKYADEDARKSKEYDDEENQDVIKIPLHPDNEDPMDVPSHTRYNEDIDIEDDFDRENRDIHRASPFNKDYLKRWNHGEFHEGPLPHELEYAQEMNRGSYRITDLDNDMEDTPAGGSFDMGMQRPKEELSSGSISEHRQGVLEEIDSDEFFLREKGISQDNIEVGKYLSSEIREAFRNPVNALSQLQSEDREYDLDASDQSESLQDVPRKKPLRKPKRKKTPSTSKEKISYDRESVTTEPEEYPKGFDEFQRFPPPARPKRRSKKGKKKKSETDDVIPYQETIPIEEQYRSFTPTNYTSEMMEGTEILPDNILGDDHQQRFYDKDIPQMYENEIMKGIEQPEIKISDPYYRYENFQQDIDRILKEKMPTAPTRRHRSQKSLEASEPDSITEEVAKQDIETYRAEHEYIIPTPEPPARPKRVRSRTQSQSGASQQEDDRTSRGAESLISDNQVEVVEDPCIQDIRDTSGYAVVDKSKCREPPLPPSRFPSTPPRTRRTKKSGSRKEDKFATVPRPLRDSPPVRPLRNYSTLGGSSRASRSMTPNEEEKENLDISDYTEIDGEPVRRLQSGEVIQKMKDRPLPAPPRPPRKPRVPTREVFRDISHERNMPPEIQDGDKMHMEETETVTSGYTSEEQQPPVKTKFIDATIADLEGQILPYDHEETVTHGALVVQPIDNAQILPYSQFCNLEQRPIGPPPMERIIPVTRECPVNVQPYKEEHKIYDDEETSEIPEEFKKLKSPPIYKPTPPSETTKHHEIPHDGQEIGVLKAQKLQVVDLDVDKLRVNELQASKIVVSELDGVTLQVSEINSKSGNLVLSGIELPPHLIQEMLDRIQSAAHDQLPSAADQSTSPQSSEATTQTIKLESASEQLQNVTEQGESVTQDENAKTGQKKNSV